MTRVKILPGGLLTVPAEARARLGLEEGDDVELTIEDGALTLRPATPMSREEAWRRFRKLQASVRYIGPEPQPSPEEEERWIFDVLAEEDEKEHA